jgi:predicted aminopeptidase
VFKKITLFVLGLLLVLGVWYHEWISYGWMQARGQARVLWQARPVAEVLADAATPDSVRQRLRLVGAIRRFAIDSLGLTDTPNYQTYFDQGGRTLLWVLTAAERYRMRALERDFPLIGTFTYKGFFDLNRARREEAELRQQGYDTDLGEVAAWSTLGYFRDPILSSMLERPDGQLANLIIHELTHSTLFVKDNHEFNENLANFVGDYGAVRFLTAQYGADSPQLRRYLQEKAFADAYLRHINRGTRQLDSLYRRFDPAWPDSVRDRLKNQRIRQIVSTVDTLYAARPDVRRRRRWRGVLPNNAFFVGFATYNARRNQVETEFQSRFGGNFRAYLTYLKSKYPSL